MNRCTEAAAVAATVPDSGVGDAGLRPTMVPRQASFFPPPVPNPFVQQTQMSAATRLQIFLLGIILLPIRALLVALILLLAWPFAAISTACCPEKLTHPIAGWRRKVTQPALKFLGRALFFSMGFIVTVKGKIASPLEAPIFVAAPHSTFFDGIACVIAGLPSMVSRNENAQVPVIGRLLRAVQPVLVSRVDPDSRKTTINEIIKRATSGGEWPQILVFPEGTCTNRSCLITFKPGAFIPGVPVQPVLLRYPNKLDTVTWTWQGYTFFQLCMLTFCQPFTKVEVEFLPVQVPNDEEKSDPVLFANKVRNIMADLYADQIIREAGLYDEEPGIWFGGRLINNLRYAGDTTLLAESEEGLRYLLMKIKDHSQPSVWIITQHKENKILTTGSISNRMINRKDWGCQGFHFFLDPQSTLREAAVKKSNDALHRTNLLQETSLKC